MPVGGKAELTFPGGGFTLPLDQLSAAAKNRIGGLAGGHIVLGVRPEHLHLRQVEGAAPMKVRLNVIEPLGSDMDVYMNTALHDHVVGRLEAQSGLQAGSEATIYVDARRVHLFEPGDTGMNLTLETASPTNEPAHALV